MTRGATPMPTYKYEAMDTSGTEVKDSVEATSEEEAQQKIRQMEPGALKNALMDVVEDVESGMTLSEAFSKHPKCFDRLYVNMVRAGEAGGALEIILQRLAEFKEKAQTLKRKIIGAMVYPAVVIMVAVSILTFIMVAIIPKFKKIFDDFNMRLPWATETLIQTSMWFADYWWVLPLFPMGLFILIKLIRLSRSGSYAVDRIKLWIPLMGKILEKSIVARTMRTLGTLVASGVPILESLAIVRETSTNVVFERMFSRVIESIREGETIADPLKQSRLGDDMVVMMIVVLGRIIGSIVICLFLPLIKLLEGVSKWGIIGPGRGRAPARAADGRA